MKYFLKIGRMYVSGYDLDDPENTLTIFSSQSNAVRFDIIDDANEVMADLYAEYGVSARVSRCVKRRVCH